MHRASEATSCEFGHVGALNKSARPHDVQDRFYEVMVVHGLHQDCNGCLLTGSGWCLTGPAAATLRARFFSERACWPGPEHLVHQPNPTEP